MKKSYSALTAVFTVITVIGLIVLFNLLMINRTSKNLHVEFTDDDVALSGIIDEYGLFNSKPSELTRLEENVRECAAEIRMNVLIYLPGSGRKSYSDYAVRSFTETEYNAHFGEFTDGLLYYIDISGKSPACDDIAKSAKANLVFTDSVCDSIFNALDRYLPSSYSNDPIDPGRIAEAINVFCELLKTKNSEGTRESYYYDGESYEPNYTYVLGGRTYVTESIPPSVRLVKLVISELIGAVTALLIFLISKRNYKFKSKTNPRIYLPNESVNFTDKSDVFQGTHTTRTKIESSSGGYGGGGRSGGGGGSHGGSIGHSSHHR